MSTNSPTPEELQKRLSEFMKQNFGDKVVFSSVMTQPEQGPTAESDDIRDADLPPVFDFHLKPRDIKEHLDRYVIRQDEAKKALAIAVCDHYNHVRAWENEMLRSASDEQEPVVPMEYAKQNVILLGPTGVGKTYLIRCIAQLIGVPFVKADATKFSETGYVGGDVDDLVRELVHSANGNTKLAQYGIVYIDEIDKIASPSSTVGRDVSGRGVQTNLLKLMEETEVGLRSPSDLPSQIQAAMEFQRKGKIKRETINTRHILFIVSGAFDRLEEIIQARLKKGRIGFQTASVQQHDIPQTELFRQVATRDFVQFGFEPEFIGRLPVRVVCDPLSEQDLLQIMQRSEGSILRQYERSFRAFGIDVAFGEDGLRAIAHLAYLEQTGARGLMTVCEKIFRDFKFHLPSTEIRSFKVTASVVKDPQSALEQLLIQEAAQARPKLEAEVREFCENFSKEHGLELRLDGSTIDGILDRAFREKRNVRDVCAQIFKNYEFGLGLVKKNTGQAEFVIPSSVLEDPDRFISELVVQSYGKPKSGAESR